MVHSWLNLWMLRNLGYGGPPISYRQINSLVVQRSAVYKCSTVFMSKMIISSYVLFLIDELKKKKWCPAISCLCGMRKTTISSFQRKFYIIHQHNLMEVNLIFWASERQVRKVCYHDLSVTQCRRSYPLLPRSTLTLPVLALLLSEFT